MHPQYGLYATQNLNNKDFYLVRRMSNCWCFDQKFGKFFARADFVSSKFLADLVENFQNYSSVRVLPFQISGTSEIIFRWCPYPTLPEKILVILTLHIEV